MNNTPLRDWIPYKFADIDGQQSCCWLDTFGLPFIEPFFEETINKCRLTNNQYTRPVVTSNPEMITKWAQRLTDVVPDMLIFHISRCGSTLLSQMFAGFSDFTVLSEVPFFDEILRLQFKPGRKLADIPSLLHAAIKFYVRQQDPKKIVIKTDSWHLFFYEQLRKIYPDTPFILLYRRPEEVFASQQKQPGMHTVPGIIEPEVFSFSRDDIPYSKPGIYFASVLESYFRQMLVISQKDSNTLLVNYHDRPFAMMEQITGFTRIALTPEDMERIKTRSRFHSKRPAEQFTGEPPAAIPPLLESASALYYRLDEQRKSRNILSPA